MAQRVEFAGKIVRVERDGFGIVEFVPALGANTHGLFSTTTSERLPSLKQLKVGVDVSGEAVTGAADLAKIKTLTVSNRSH